MPWLSKYYSSTKIRPVESEATRWTAPAPTGWAASAPPPGRPWPGSTIPSTAIAADWLFNSSGGVVSTPDLVSFLLDHTLRYPRFRVLSAHLHTSMINSSIEKSHMVGDPICPFGLDLTKAWNTVSIGYSNLGYSGRAAYSDLNPRDGLPSVHK